MFRVGTDNEYLRRIWIKETLEKLPPGITLLDAGAGESQYKAYCSHLKYISQDFGQYDGSGEVGLQEGVWDNSKLDIVSDITKIPLPDKSVDAIMCTEVFEHIPNPFEALKEFNRLLKPQGFLIITAPFVSFTHFAPYHYLTGFSRFFYDKHLPAYNFNIIDMQESGNYFDFIAQENRRIKSVAKKYTGKTLSLFERICIHFNLLILQRLSKKGGKSSELLCYGIHVLAQKK